MDYGLWTVSWVNRGDIDIKVTLYEKMLKLPILSFLSIFTN